jgi:hypothetical protein
MSFTISYDTNASAMDGTTCKTRRELTNVREIRVDIMFPKLIITVIDED